MVILFNSANLPLNSLYEYYRPDTTLFEDYIRDTSHALLNVTEDWAASNDCDTTTAECRNDIVGHARRAYGITNQLSAFEAM